MVVRGLTGDDSGLIGFVISCMYSSALTQAEMRQWVLHMIDKNDPEELPLYMFDLMDYDDDLCKIHRIVGPSSGWKHTYGDDLALSGIAVARGVKLFEEPAPPAVLLKKLQERPWLFKKYKETFPFIDVSAIEKKLFASSNIK